MSEIVVFFACWAQLLLGLIGPLVLLGLIVEGAYRLIFWLLGQRAGRVLWWTSCFLGTPAHEAGHALMCLLFAHRIERVRLFPTRAGNAMVQHSYRKSNPYAVLGNFFIGLGPIVLILALVYLVLYWIAPQSMQEFRSVLLSVREAPGQLLVGAFDFFVELVCEQSRAIWARLVALAALLSLSLHVRLSPADVRSMCRAIPLLLLLSGGAAGVFVLLGETARHALYFFLSEAVLTCGVIASPLLVIVLIQLILAMLWRLVCAIAHALFA